MAPCCPRDGVHDAAPSSSLAPPAPLPRSCTPVAPLPALPALPCFALGWDGRGGSWLGGLGLKGAVWFGCGCGVVLLPENPRYLAVVRLERPGWWAR
jgi:hypothetical protein